MLLSDVKKDSNFASIPTHTLQPDLLRSVIASFIDGILILTIECELIHANRYAHDICHQLISKNTTSNVVPDEIWCVCQSLMESRELFTVESEVTTKQGMKFRIRARWLQLGGDNYDLLLVTVEDYNQYTQSLAIADAKKYHLTDRETQVWLLRRANYSYQEIATRLYITINTVKKHLQNIYAKQRSLFCPNSYGEMPN
ncbi:MAG: helix-turn-helix transcriptional regulator [Goleter apudmare HA4340-LM2]|nr:helix-turn-helix transcriptional regulator [Goleter apudmare HA4340-LM2]